MNGGCWGGRPVLIAHQLELKMDTGFSNSEVFFEKTSVAYVRIV
jgi:hypothetical protein